MGDDYNLYSPYCPQHKTQNKRAPIHIDEHHMRNVSQIVLIWPKIIIGRIICTYIYIRTFFEA